MAGRFGRASTTSSTALSCASNLFSFQLIQHPAVETQSPIGSRKRVEMAESQNHPEHELFEPCKGSARRRRSSAWNHGQSAISVRNQRLSLICLKYDASPEFKLSLRETSPAKLTPPKSRERLHLENLLLPGETDARPLSRI